MDKENDEADDRSPYCRKDVLTNFKRYSSNQLQFYSSKRNFDLGRPHKDVSKLSPYLRRRLITENEVLHIALKKNTPLSLEKFIQEIFWRTYWRGWLEMRPDVYQDYVNVHNETHFPSKTGIKCFDHWTEELIETGYLHNHARMWYASIWIFTLRKSWFSGANFFKDFLLDWCPASNTLGWRWVAGLQTRGKIYSAKADNIKLFTNNRFFPKGELNESPVFDEAIWKTFDSSSGKPCENRNFLNNEDIGLIINKNDLSLNRYLNEKQIKFQGCIFHDPGYQNSKSVLVQKFESGLIEELCLELKDFHFSQSKKALASWAKSKKLKYLIFPFETVGNRYFMENSFINELRSQNIEPIFYMRDWDRYAFPHASKGFFPFKKNISDLLVRNNII